MADKLREEGNDHAISFFLSTSSISHDNGGIYAGLIRHSQENSSFNKKMEMLFPSDAAPRSQANPEAASCDAAAGPADSNCHAVLKPQPSDKG